MKASPPHLPNSNDDDIIDVVVSGATRPTGSSAEDLAEDLIEIHDYPFTNDANGSTIDVVAVNGARRRQPATPSNNVRNVSNGALVTTGKSFSSLLAPLTQDRFKEVVQDVEQRLLIVNQTLSMLDMQGFDTILEEMLGSITAKTGELLNADRTTIFLLDEERGDLYTNVAREGGGTVEIRVPLDKGIAGEVATFKKVVNISYDFFDDPRSEQAQIQYKKMGYRSYTMLALPLLTEEGDLVAVVQLINKLKKNVDPNLSLDHRIDLQGFTEQDEQVFKEFAPSIRLILESSRSFYLATQKQRATNALIQATQSLSKSSLDLESTLKNVMDEAKKLMKADRSTLWLVDEERGQLWTKFPINGVPQEVRIPLSSGSFAGQVAITGNPLLIPFDLYDHPNSQTSKETDAKTGYRTCSLLCMPVF
ncbi:MAG TPA: GAF domain-containing protein, partial [Thermosynechococcaceae cyanobacterium]